MDRIDILNNLINDILDTKLIFKEISYKLENNLDGGIYIVLYTKADHIKKTSKIYYDSIKAGINYLQGIKKTIYLLEMENLSNE